MVSGSTSAAAVVVSPCPPPPLPLTALDVLHPARPLVRVVLGGAEAPRPLGAQGPPLRSSDTGTVHWVSSGFPLSIPLSPFSSSSPPSSAFPPRSSSSRSPHIREGWDVEDM